MTSLKFTKVENPTLLLPVLQSRHPHSCFMYNQVIKSKGFKNCLTFYMIGDELVTDTWIVSDNIRKDDGSHICISAPPAITQGLQEIDPEIRNVFATGANFVDWENDVTFVALEKTVAKMIMEISVDLKGNVTEVHPCNLYYMEIEDALNLQIRSPSPSVEMRKLDATKPEEIDFLITNSKYARPESHQDFCQCIQASVSGGVFLEEKCVSGVYSTGYGLLSALYTSKEQRGKGYGKLAMSFAIQQSAQENCIPCCIVERRNMRSNRFHQAIGVKFVSVVDWIDVKKLDID